MPRKTTAKGDAAAGAAGFNEAAARCRGKRPGKRGARRGLRRASMRPRPDAAENSRSATRGGPSPPHRFNEAAARCRGKLALESVIRWWMKKLQ